MIRFLTKDEIIGEQNRQLTAYGGGEPGVVNPDALSKALAQPQKRHDGQFMCVDVFEMAASYLVCLVKGHAFAEANRRTALSSALTFLYINGHVVIATADEAVQLVTEVIADQMDEIAVAEFFTTHVDEAASEKLQTELAGGEESAGSELDDATDWVNTAFNAAFVKLAQ